MIIASLEAIGIGWIYGFSRLKENLKMMSGKYPNVYWAACYSFLTPVATISGLVLALIANSEVKLNEYRYPQWAHNIGWGFVLIILAPILLFYHISLSRYNFARVSL